ncbi:MAG: ABC transporter permease [Flexilinea sp.]
MKSEKAQFCNNLTTKVSSQLGKYSVVISMLIIFFGFSVLNKNFMSARNIQNIFSAAAPLFLMSMGLSFVILTGSIDLSTGAVCSCTCVLTGLFIDDIGNVIYLVVIVVGVLAGLFNGILVAKNKLPSFIVTLCTASIWKCVALVVSHGASKSIPIEKWNIINWAKSTVLVFPIPYIIAFVIFLFFLFIERRTSMGKSIYAVGANANAARMCGIQIDKAQITAFLLSGVGSALAGACYALRLKSSAPTIGDSLNLLAVAVVVLGGTWLSGGKGTVASTLPSVLTVIMLQSALKVVGLDAYWQDIIFGIILIGAIYLNSDRSGRKDVIIK